MPVSIVWPPRHSSRSPRQRRPLLIFILIVLALAIVFGGRSAVSYYVDALWFNSLGYGDVFWKTLSYQWSVFAVFAAATFLILFGAFTALRRAHSADLPSSHTVFIGEQPVKLPVGLLLTLVGFAVPLLVAAASAASMTANWRVLMLYRYAPPAATGTVDPIFGKSLNFFLFTLPAWQLISDWLMTIAVITCGIAIFFLLITGGTRALAGDRGSLALLSWRGFSATFAFFLLVLAIRVYISRFEQVLADHTVFSGVTYTDAHVILPGLLAVCVALLVGAAIAAVKAVSTPRVRWLAIAIIPAFVCYLAVQAFGWYVSSFIVKPNELVRERPYITHNIALTRQAYGLDGITQREFPAETSIEATDASNNQATLQNIRLWDWRALQDTLRQIQEIRTYYDFPDIDIDRYEIEGNIRQVMLATRELNVTKLPESSRNWINEKLIYTHGYGITMNPVNGFTPEGLPSLILSNMPVESTVRGIEVKRPEIYFGELTNTDVYVKTRQKEFNYPQGQNNTLTSYEGTGGIVIGGFLRRLILAIDQNDLAKLPFSDDVNSESRLLMRRNVRRRVAALAPFLFFERDPYIVLGDNGRLFWMMDAFTTSDSYPYSRHYLFGGQPVNYARNSVKVVIDAYNGTTTFYVFDPTDPIIGAYRRIFPSLFKDANAMPATLRKHVRYPELLLKLQASVYGLYHMTEPVVFYNREDLWTPASESGVNERGERATVPIEPNFVLMKLPGESGMEFVDILPFTPANRNNLIGWIAGRSDGAHYGTAVVYNFPKTKLIDGPLQVEARIDQDPQLSGQLTLWNQQGSHVRRGSLLVIPIGRALLYAEPIYLQAERSPMPQLRLVVLAVQDKLAYGPTFEAAMTELFGRTPLPARATGAPGQPAAPTPASAAQPSAELKALITEAARDLEDYQRLTSTGKLGEAGQKLEHLKRTLEQLNARQR